MVSNNDFRREWLASIYQRYAEDVHNVIRFRLYPYGLTSASDDLLQDIFITAFDKCERLIAHPDIRRWLFATANYKCRNFVRKQAVERRRILLQTNAAQPDLPDLTAEEALARILDETIDCEVVLQRMKEGMTDSERQLYTQAYEEKATLLALATTYGISEAAMKMRISRLRKRILLVIKNILYSMLRSILTHIL